MLSHITRVEVLLADDIGAGDRVRLAWSYSGWIAPDRVELGVDAMHTDWVELDIGSLWLPIRETLTERFTYAARVTIPDGYDVVGAGSAVRDGSAMTFETTHPHLSATIAVAPKMRSTTVPGDVEITVHNPGAAPEMESLARHAARAATMFSEWFGSIPSASKFQIVLPPDRRSRSEGYSRDRYIMIIEGIDPGPERLRIAVHEVAHLWWNHAPSQAPSNFLNESFAEYTTWLVLKEIHGVYSRGPLILHQLHDGIGHDAFYRLLREVRARAVDDSTAS